jgi:hypothetical protein
MVLNMGDTESNKIRLDNLDEISVIWEASSFNFFLEFLDELIIRGKLIHVVMRKGEFRFEVAIIIEHLYVDSLICITK